MPFPQLRVKTGYSFRNAYGQLSQVIERASEIGADFVGVVDDGTWSHVKFEQAAKKASLDVGFGMEFPVLSYDANGDVNKAKPRAWMLAKDTKHFYQWCSHAVQNSGMTAQQMASIDSDHVIRFTGGALDLPPDAYDFIDVNPASLTHAYNALELARRTSKPTVITSLNDYPHEDQRGFAAAWEVRTSVGPRAIYGEDDLRRHLAHVMTANEFDRAVSNTHAIADRIRGIKLARAPIIQLEGDLEELAREGMRMRLAKGHIKEWTNEYEERFRLELETIRGKSFDSYFLCVSDLVRYAKQHMLVGPARGSSAGSLICYLTEITEVDPVKYGLLFFRFLDPARPDMPDVDIDFSDTKRHMVIDYLRAKYGESNVSKVGNVNMLKVASTIECVRKKFDLGFEAVQQLRNSTSDHAPGDALYGHSLEDAMLNTDAGRLFAERYPIVAACMGDIELHPSHAGVHAAGILVCNEPVSCFCTVTDEGVAQIDKQDAEYLNLLKIDALGLRTLGVIEDSGVITSDELFALEPTDESVLAVLGADKVSGVFQSEGDTARGISRQLKIDKFDVIDHIGSLARPGPLSSGMVQRYIERANGREAVTYAFPELEPILKSTYGVLVYQEQIMMIVREIGGFEWTKIGAVRKAMGTRKGAEYMDQFRIPFVEGGVAKGIKEEALNKLWAQMCEFGSYAFNRSHSVSYGLVTYWTLYMKRYHKLEYMAACLRAAKDDEQTVALLKELIKEGVQYTALDPDFSDMNWRVANGKIVGGIRNAVGYGPVLALKYVQKREAGTLTDKDRTKLAKAKVKFAELYEAHALFGWAYNDPRKIGVTSGNPIQNIMDVKDGDDGLFIGKVISKSIEDDNDPKRIKQRIERGQQGKRKGATTFIDLSMTDDSTEKPMKVRIRPDKYDDFGRACADDPKGTWYLVKGWKLSGISMFIVKNIKKVEPNEPNEGTESVGHGSTEPEPA